MSLDNFTGTKDIMLQPNDDAVPYTFTFSVCSSSTANDGALPYGTNISSVADTEIVDSSSVNNNVVSVAMNYPTTNGEGRYDLKFVATLDNSSVLEFDFRRIYAEDI